METLLLHNSVQYVVLVCFQSLQKFDTLLLNIELRLDVFFQTLAQEAETFTVFFLLLLKLFLEHSFHLGFFELTQNVS